MPNPVKGLRDVEKTVGQNCFFQSVGNIIDRDSATSVGE